MKTQPVKKGWLKRRAGRLAASVLLFSLLMLPPPTAAQEQGVNQAGLVIQFGDGRVHTACVDLGPDGQATGEELLRASGLAPVVDYGSGMGGTVCKIGNEGCNSPTEKCFCQCSMKPGEPCVYWSYFHLLDGQWRYSIQGANSYIVGPGDVEGWAWGPGTTAGGTQPPFVPFEQICVAPPAAPLPTETRTPVFTLATTTQPAETTVSTDTPPPSVTPWPTTPVFDTPTPTIKPFIPSPPPTKVATDTVTPTSPPSPALTAERAASATPTPAQAQQIAAVTATQRPAAGREQSALASPSQEVSDSARATTGYIFFGALATVLVVGLIVLRVRQP